MSTTLAPYKELPNTLVGRPQCPYQKGEWVRVGPENPKGRPLLGQVKDTRFFTSDGWQVRVVIGEVQAVWLPVSMVAGRWAGE